eukprot:902012-Pelagomonas_calceolata.AAC.7
MCHWYEEDLYEILQGFHKWLKRLSIRAQMLSFVFISFSRFEPARGWLGQSLTEKVEGWPTKVWQGLFAALLLGM